MIDLSGLSSSDIGRTVVYTPRRGSSEHGVITSWNRSHIFVRYEGAQQSKATSPEDLSFAHDYRYRIREVTIAASVLESIRGKHDLEHAIMWSGVICAMIPSVEETRTREQTGKRLKILIWPYGRSWTSEWVFPEDILSIIDHDKT